MHIQPHSFREKNIAVTMARISLKAMSQDDPRRELAVERLRKATEDLRTFKYRQHQALTPSGKLIRR